MGDSQSRFTCGYCSAPLDRCKCVELIPELDCAVCAEKDKKLDDQALKIDELMNVVRELAKSPTKESTVVLRVTPWFMEKIRQLHDGKLPG